MTNVELNITIDRPPAEVFDFIANFENNALWQSGVEEATFTAGGPQQVGAKCTQISKFLGRRIEFHFEVVAYEPNRTITYKSQSGSFPVEVTRRVEPVNGGTQVTAIIDGDAGGFMKLAEPLLNRMTQRSIEADYATLKAYLEARNEP